MPGRQPACGPPPRPTSWLAGTSVLDLGAGAMLLRDRLDPGCRYLPVDLFRFAADMVVHGSGAGGRSPRSAGTTPPRLLAAARISA